MPLSHGGAVLVRMELAKIANVHTLLQKIVAAKVQGLMELATEKSLSRGIRSSRRIRERNSQGLRSSQRFQANGLMIRSCFQIFLFVFEY